MLVAKPIDSFYDGQVEANALQVLYGPAKGQVLRSYPWRCASKTVTLATLADQPVNPDWAFAHAWPEDAIRIVKVFELQYPHNPEPEWVVEGRTILTKTDNVAAQYIYDTPEPHLDVHVEMALAAKLALDMSYTLTASNTRESNLYSMFQEKMQEARTTDRQEGSHVKFRIDTLSRVR